MAMDVEEAPLRYRLILEDDVFFVGGGDKLLLPVTFLLESSEPIVLNDDGPDPIRLGARLVKPTEDDEAEPEILGEFRAEVGRIAVEPGRKYSLMLELDFNYPFEIPCQVIVDLVKENHYWFTQRGHKAATLDLEQTYVLRRTDADPLETSFKTSRQFARAQKQFSALFYSLLQTIRGFKKGDKE